MAGRFDTGRRLGYRDESISDMDGRHRDYMAAQAEEWVMGWLNHEAQLVAGHLRRDDGWDIEFRGQRIDVKWTGWEPGGKWKTPTYVHLVVPEWKPRRSDVYVLVIGSSPDRFDLYDWASGWEMKRVVEQAPVHDWGKKRKTSGRPAPMFVIGFDYLRRMDTLIDLKERRS
jgi:hypothetical protein